jgi:hypothetical protein
MIQVSPFEDLLNFLSDLAPAEILAFKLSEKTIQRVRFLLDLEQKGQLSSPEKEELNHYCIQEDFINMAKAKAIVRLRVAQ